ncbi:hypothetical protein MKEN_00714400 [Mycena kentingensis (nom. inval.)]|nr:hypothetical protein MKEN_00714400 [Mycena kentingensis (nom. inval.)]
MSVAAATPTIPCALCGKDGVFRCSGCRATCYCSAACQRKDWKAHKGPCSKAPKWYDKHRKCRDDSLHEGRMELITWACKEEETGWGAVFEDEAEDLKKRFETEFGGDEAKFYDYRPGAFRWTCCGMRADMDYGCDHHGSGKKPCTCDFCRMGKPLPDSVYFDKTSERHGLKLNRGPDPRSANLLLGTIAEAARTMMGLEL